MLAAQWWSRTVHTYTLFLSRWTNSGRKNVLARSLEADNLGSAQRRAEYVLAANGHDLGADVALLKDGTGTVVWASTW